MVDWIPGTGVAGFIHAALMKEGVTGGTGGTWLHDRCPALPGQYRQGPA